LLKTKIEEKATAWHPGHTLNRKKCNLYFSEVVAKNAKVFSGSSMKCKKCGRKAI
jgi:hypothetical protein